MARAVLSTAEPRTAPEWVLIPFGAAEGWTLGVSDPCTRPELANWTEFGPPLAGPEVEAVPRVDPQTLEARAAMISLRLGAPLSTTTRITRFTDRPPFVRV